jgi:hypothetical protein
VVLVAVKGGIPEILEVVAWRLMLGAFGVVIVGAGVELRDDSLRDILETLAVEGATEAEREAELRGRSSA